jgi:hypothetical protein
VLFEKLEHIKCYAINPLTLEQKQYSDFQITAVWLPPIVFLVFALMCFINFLGLPMLLNFTRIE